MTPCDQQQAIGAPNSACLLDHEKTNHDENWSLNSDSNVGWRGKIKADWKGCLNRNQK